MVMIYASQKKQKNKKQNAELVRTPTTDISCRNRFIEGPPTRRIRLIRLVDVPVRVRKTARRDRGRAAASWTSGSARELSICREEMHERVAADSGGHGSRARETICAARRLQRCYARRRSVTRGGGRRHSNHDSVFTWIAVIIDRDEYRRASLVTFFNESI